MSGHAMNFDEAVVEFRTLMGTKSFWNLPLENREGALKALNIAMLSGKSQFDEETVGNFWMATVTEYQKRAMMLGKEF